MPREEQTPSLVPAFDVTVHLVLNDLGKLGRSYLETDEDHADLETIILDVRSTTDEERTEITRRFETAHARLRDALFRMGQYAFGVTSDAEN